ncbi:MAG: hypothetical protein F9K48_05055 [Candidatus Brocadia sp.]|nr:MAG: hypothetical protein F9K48_05055 [Candidatus Brocadia sp.]
MEQKQGKNLDDGRAINLIEINFVRKTGNVGKDLLLGCGTNCRYTVFSQRSKIMGGTTLDAAMVGWGLCALFMIRMLIKRNNCK